LIGHEGPEVDSSTLSLTSALEWGVGGLRYAPTALPPGMTQYPLCRRLGGHHSQSGWVQKISPLLGFDPQTIQPVANRYTIPAHSPQAYIYVVHNYIRIHYTT